MCAYIPYAGVRTVGVTFFMANYKPAPQGRSNGSVSGALKPGEYPATVIQVQVKISKCGNYEQHALRVRVEDAANDHWEDFWERLTFSDVAMWKVEQALQGVGLDAGVEPEILPEDWLEKRCWVELVEKQGELQIKRWLTAQRVSKPPVVAKPASVMRLPSRSKMPNALERLQAAGRAAVAAEDGLPF